MRIERIAQEFTVCTVADLSQAELQEEFCFVGKTDREISLVCRTASVPGNVLEREDGWRAFRVEGVLDFSLTGVLAGLSVPLAENGIGIFAVSTFQTDYLFIKEQQYERALSLLAEKGWELPPR